jgi:hypothetical protein
VRVGDTKVESVDDVLSAAQIGSDGGVLLFVGKRHVRRIFVKD